LRKENFQTEGTALCKYLATGENMEQKPCAAKHGQVFRTGSDSSVKNGLERLKIRGPNRILAKVMVVGIDWSCVLLKSVKV
jgi:hypothetical protein